MMPWLTRPAILTVYLLVALLSVRAAAEAPVAIPSPATWARPSVIQAVTMTPKGDRLAGLRTIDGRPRLVIWGRGDDFRRTKPLDFEEDRIAWFGWTGNRFLLVSAARFVTFRTRGFYQRHLYVVDATDGSFTLLLPPLDGDGRYEGQYRDLLVDLLPADDRHILLGYDLEKPGWPGVWRVDMATGTARRVQPPRPPVINWLADAEGRVRVGTGYEGPRRKVFAVEASGDLIPLADDHYVFGPVFSVLATDRADPDWLYVLSDHENGRAGLYRYGIKAGQFGERLFLDDTYDVRSVTFDPEDGRPTAVRLDAEEDQVIALSDQLVAFRAQVREAAPDLGLEIQDLSHDGQVALLRSTGADDAGGVYLFDRATGRLSVISRMRPWLDPIEPAPVSMISVRTRDGVDIPAVLTRPPAITGQSMGPGRGAGVILPHGGPVSRDRVSFSAMVQMLAAHGFTVLQPNYRGSSGYGRAFRTAGYNEWGGLMQRDITDAARWLRDSGLIDPARLAIVGGSFGGYSALKGLVDHPTLYRAGVALNPVADVGLLVENLSLNRFGQLTTPRIAGGQDASDLAEISPLGRVATIRAPLLFLHSQRDASVSYLQSERLAAALDEASKVYRFITLPDDGHSLQQAEDREVYYAALLAFLKRHLQDREAGPLVPRPDLKEDIAPSVGEER